MAAPLSLRIGAAVIDGPLIGLLLTALTWGTLVVFQDLLVMLAVSAFVSIAYSMLIWAMLARNGSSPGKALVGIQVVRESASGRIGWGTALVRLLLRGLLVGLTLGLASLSVVFDPHRRAWWDRAVGTWVVRVGTSTRRPASAPSPEDASVLVTGAVTAVRTDWDNPEPASKVKKVVAEAGWSDQIAQAPESVAPRPAASAGRIEPSSPPFSWSAAPKHSQGTAHADSAAQPSGLITSVPGRPPREGNGPPSGLAPEIEMTRLSSRATPVAARTTELVLDTGDRHTLRASALIGRDPSPTPGDPEIQLIAISDTTRSVSKTHLLVELMGGSIRVTDRHSTNGVRIRLSDGSDRRLSPGVPHDVPNTATVWFGDRYLTLDSA